MNSNIKDIKDLRISPTRRAASLLLAGVLATGGIVGPCATIVGLDSMNTTAYAATLATLDRDHAVSLTLHKYDSLDKATVNADGTVDSADDIPEGANAIEGVVFSYLKIATMNSDSTFTLNEDGAAILGVDKSNTYTVSKLQALLAEKNAGSDVAAADSFAGKATAMTATDGEGVAKKEDMAQGLYIVAETAAPASVSETVDPFLVALPMASATSDGWNYDVDVYPKNNVETVTIDKTVKDDGDGDFAEASSTTIGDDVTYQVKIDLPKVTTAATKFTALPFEDSVDFEAEYKTGITVSLGDKTVSGDSLIAKDKLSGDLLNLLGADYVNAAAKAGNAQITVTYTAHINGLTVGKDNDNNTKIEVKRKGSGKPVTDTDVAPVYSYGVDLTKTLEGEDGDVTQAKFTLQNATDNGYIVANKTAAGEYTVTGKTASQAEATQFSTNEQGKLVVKGIEADTYKLVETQAPTGFSLLAEPITIKIDFSYNETEAGDISDTSTALVNNANADFEDGLVSVSALNKKKLVLPLTGGEGTLLITLLGAAALGAGTAAVYRRKHKGEAQQSAAE